MTAINVSASLHAHAWCWILFIVFVLGSNVQLFSKGQVYHSDHSPHIPWAKQVYEDRRDFTRIGPGTWKARIKVHLL